MRSRLIAAVAVVTAAVAGAGTPAVLGASSQVADTQRLLDLAKLTRQTTALAHALTDERDEFTAYAAAGRPEGERPESAARVDRQIAELRDEAPDGLQGDLAAFAGVREHARTGKDSALEVHTAYTEALEALHRRTQELADRLPPRAGTGGHALADLDRAVAEAGSVRGLLLAAYATPRTAPQTVIDPPPLSASLEREVPPSGLSGTTVVRGEDDERRDALTAAAQQAHRAEEAALDAFTASAPADQRAKLDTTVTGPDVADADRYLARLTDKPSLSERELGYDSEKIATALTARIDQLRSVENTLATEHIKRLTQLRDEDVTALELRIALAGALALLALGVCIAVARTLTRPLAVLRLGTARLAESEGGAAAEPVRFTGRNDEFAAVVRSVNALYERTAKLQERAGVLDADRSHLLGEREELARERAGLRKELAAARDELHQAEESVQHTFVNLALRTLGLIDRQLAVIEGLEEREEDPESLATLFKLDHFATVMRRHSENLLVLAGAEHKHAHPGPVPLVDVVRAAVSEIERYDRVRIGTLPPHAHLAGFAADDLSHLLAELLENATSFSPPDAQVEISGWLLESGEVMLSVQDEGIGLAPERLRTVNTMLDDGEAAKQHTGSEEGLGLGLHVVARLAARHGVRVRLREGTKLGTTAVTVLPKPLLAPAPAAPPTPRIPRTDLPGELHLAGAEAEANSNVLPGRTATEPLPGFSPTAAPTAAQVRADSVPDAGDALVPGAGVSSDVDRVESVPGTGGGPVREAARESVREEGTGEEAGGTWVGSERDPVLGGDDPVAAAFGVREPRAAQEPGTARDGDAEREQGEPTGPDEAERLVETTLELTLPAPGTDTPARLRPTRIVAVPDDHAHERAAHERAADETPRRPAEPVRDDAPVRDVPPVRDDMSPVRDDMSPVREDVPPVRDGGTVRREAPVRDEEPAPGQAPPHGAERPPVDEPAPVRPGSERVTDKGLPKRTPKVSAPASRQAPSRPRGLDAEDLRRRLAGFRQGAQAGRRDAESETPGARTATTDEPAAPADVPEQRRRVPAQDRNASHSSQESTDPGDSLKEARS
ncbi:nitrate- and nitrite sensing domain-containing protein [Streptomyces sp. KLOTTS4A1]|uniref:sensor histidine kinase n=1 Tax=Streptomyces sp. KLOTTS4A1 TaxID=3390996 RepID=UPI0039F4B75E